MRININDLPPKYRKQALRQIASTGSIPGKATHMEQAVSNAPLGQKKTQGFDGQVDVYFFEKRHRLADPDGACIKYALDSLVSCKILRDDSAKEIGKTPKEQVKVGGDEPEETIIEIWRKGE